MKKRRNLKSWSKCNVPVDVWTNILSRLPVKSVLRFRCVSKPWKSLIDESAFCCLHLQNFKNNRNETHLFVEHLYVSENNLERICTVRSCGTFMITAIFGPLDTVIFGECGVVNVVDGLVMIRYQYGPQRELRELVLWNPSIRRTRKLPHSPAVSAPLWNFDLGIGFSPSIKDYKLVRLVLERGNGTVCSVSVYTVGTGVWKSIESRDTGISDWQCTVRSESTYGVVCFSGALYFIAYSQNSGGKAELKLVAFDLIDEVFSFTVLPTYERGDEISRKYREFISLLDGGCWLGVVCVVKARGCIWAMESSGAWVKRHVFSSEIQEISPDKYVRPFFKCMNKNCQMFLEWYVDGKIQLSSYNLDTGEEEKLGKPLPRYILLNFCIYKESLMLLNG